MKSRKQIFSHIIRPAIINTQTQLTLKKKSRKVVSKLVDRAYNHSDSIQIPIISIKHYKRPKKGERIALKPGWKTFKIVLNFQKVQNPLKPEYKTT